MAETTKPKRDVKFIKVPPGTRASLCNGRTCGRKIWWTINPVTKRMLPVSCDVEGGQVPSEHAKDPTQESLFGDKVEHHAGRGTSHFLDCPDANLFSRGAR